MGSGGISKSALQIRGPYERRQIFRAIQSVKHRGTANIKQEAKLWKQADGSFGVVNTLPSLVCEVS